MKIRFQILTNASQQINKIGKPESNHGKFSSGFTLIELLSVIAIVGILAAVIMTVVNPIEQLGKSRDGKRKSELEEVQKALELYYQDNGSYPDSSGGVIVGPNGEANWGSNGFAPYMQQLPKDPSSGKHFFYSSTQQSYYLFASLDRGGKDPAACHPDGTPCSAAQVVGASCGTGQSCNYGVSSPNVSVNE